MISDIYEKAKQKRINKKMSQEDLAYFAMTTQFNVSRFENGRLNDKDVEHRIFEALQINPDFLLEEISAESQIKDIPADFSGLDYHELNPYCEWSYWIEGKKRYTKDYIAHAYINGISLKDLFFQTEIHHIFGRCSNSFENLINILKTPLHSRSHSHNTYYDKSLLTDYCLIKFAKGEMGVRFIKERNRLDLFPLMRDRFRVLSDNHYFMRACVNNRNKRMAKYNYDPIEIIEDLEPDQIYFG
jgi:transcriptional regulator with XRE-family HTH domain